LRRSAIIKNTGADDILCQHCILTWSQQDSAKGQCPMCRQSKQAFENNGDIFPNPEQSSSGNKATNEEGGALLVCMASAQGTWVGSGHSGPRDTLEVEASTGVPLLQS